MISRTTGTAQFIIFCAFSTQVLGQIQLSCGLRLRAKRLRELKITRPFDRTSSIQARRPVSNDSPDLPSLSSDIQSEQGALLTTRYHTSTCHRHRARTGQAAYDCGYMEARARHRRLELYLLSEFILG